MKKVYLFTFIEKISYKVHSVRTRCISFECHPPNSNKLSRSLEITILKKGEKMFNLKYLENY